MVSDSDSGIMMDTGVFAEVNPGSTGRMPVVSPIPVKKYLFVLVLILVMTIALLVILIIRQHQILAEETAENENLQMAEEM